MRFNTLFLAPLALTSACAVRTVYREDPPPMAVAAGPVCSPDFPCANAYYWDEWREVYVFYDGYRYIDCTGLPGGYPLPPQGILYTAPPRGYVPPSAWVPARGTYRPPRGYVSRGAPPPGGVVVQPPPSSNGRGYGFAPPPAAGGVYVAPPPASGGGYVAPNGGTVQPPAATGHAYVAPAGGEVAPPPPPPPGNRYGSAPPPASGGFVAPNNPGRAYEAPARTYESPGQGREPNRGFEAPPAAAHEEPGLNTGREQAPVGGERYENPNNLPGAQRLPPPGTTPQNPNNKKPPPAPPAPSRPAGAPAGRGARTR